jgi:hypothetical protein
MWVMLLWIAGLIIGIWVTTASFITFLFWCEMKMIGLRRELDDLGDL